MSMLINPYRYAAAGGGTTWDFGLIATDLWLDASDAATITHVSNAISQWNDKSGRGYHLTQATAGNKPTLVPTGLNSLGTISFDGSDHLNRTTATRVGSNVNKALILLVRKATNFSTNKIMLDVATTGGTRMQQYVTSGQKDGMGGRTVNADAGAFISSTNNASNGSWDILAYEYDYSNTDIRLYRNGVQDASSTSFNSATTTQDVNTNGLTVGASTSGTLPFIGEIAEIVVIPHDVSVTMRQRAEGRLAHKWALTANLDVSHPYKSSAPTINLLTEDPYWGQTIVCCKYDGANGSTTITDLKGHTFTAQGNAQLSTAQSVQGGSSLLLDGTGDCVTAAESSDFNGFTINDRWTIETYARRPGATSGVLAALGDDSGGLFAQFNLETFSGQQNIYIRPQKGTTGWWKQNVHAFDSNFAHYAAVCDGTALTIYREGVSIGALSSFSFSTVNMPYGVVLGASYNLGALSGFLNGNMDLTRITKAARYSGSFTPPTDYLTG